MALRATRTGRNFAQMLRSTSALTPRHRRCRYARRDNGAPLYAVITPLITASSGVAANPGDVLRHAVHVNLERTLCAQSDQHKVPFAQATQILRRPGRAPDSRNAHNAHELAR